MINTDTNKIIAVSYPKGAGGKFLLNCMGLSDSMVLQDQELAKKQIKGEFAPEEKFQFLMTKIQETGHHWRDLDLGCSQLFSDIDYQKIWYDIRAFSMTPVIDYLSKNQLYFGLVSHSLGALKNQLGIWTNARVLLLNNTEKFLTATRPGALPKKKLSADIVQEIKRHDDDFVFEVSKKHDVYHWDCDWFLDENNCVENIKSLYDHYGLDTFNECHVRLFYRSWFAKIKHSTIFPRRAA
jgi:hypothetical protein